MSGPQTALARLARGLRVLATAWLIFLSAVALTDHGTLAHYKKEVSQVRSTRSEVSSLQARVSGVEGALDAFKRQLPTATAGALEAMRTSLEARLTALEERVSGTASEEELSSAKMRLTTLEERQPLRISQVTSAPPSSHRPSAIALSPDPPFKLLSIDWRGGERFVALALRDANALEPVRLLRVGDRLTDIPGDWQLQALEDKAAVFVSQGRQQRISVP